MKMFFLALVLCVAAHGAEVPAAETQFAFVALRDGRVLKNAVPIKFTSSLVVFRCNLGAISVRYEFLPDDVRAEMEKKRIGGAKWFPGETSGNTDTITGQAFVQTKGNSSYKFGNFQVYVFDLHLLNSFGDPKQTVVLPKPINQTTTDADGKFSIKVPKNRTYFIFAQTSRMNVNADNKPTDELFEWRVPMTDIRSGKLLMLSNDNLKPTSRVQIEPME